MKKFLKLITIFTLVIVGAVAANRSEKINFVSTAQAVGDLTINWGVPSGDPIFNIPNFLPGDEETATVIISNGGTSNRSLGLRIADVTDLQNLSSHIDLVIKENGIEIFNATLSDLIAQATEPGFLQFDILPPSTSATYDFFASAKSGLLVSHQSISAYGAYASPLIIAASIPTMSDRSCTNERHHSRLMLFLSSEPRGP